MKRLLLALLVFAFAPFAHAQDASTAVPASPEQVKLSYAPIVKKVAPAVVNIYTRRTVQNRGMQMMFNDPLFEQFFNGFAPMRKRVEQSLGSGFIIDTHGLIVTNAHVIKDAEEIMVVLTDGREYAAKSVLVDTPSDIGLLRVDTKGVDLPVAVLASSDALEVGDLVLAIGNPFGVGQTVTSGIVSAVARSNTDINDFDFFIQTDAAINPGNSGGPLVAMDGTVIGVNSAIYSRSGGSLGIGFAVPSEMVRAVIAAEKSGQVSTRGVKRPWLGFVAQTMTSDIANSLGFSHPQGALVSDIVAGGPADDAGLKRGDVIIAINDRPLRDAEELRFRIATLAMGESASLKVKRQDGEETLTFTATPPAEIPARDAVTVTGANPLDGATVINVSPAVIEDMDIAGQNDGVVVQAIRKGSTAARVGLEIGDGIIAVGDRKVSDTRKLQSLLDPRANPRGWVITIRRQGRDQTVILR